MKTSSDAPAASRTTASAHEVLLDIHGVRVRCDFSEPACACEIGRDFSYFVRADAASPAVRICAFLRRPDFSRLNDAGLLWKFRGLAVHRRKHGRLINYDGLALAEWDARSETVEISSPSADLLHELVYLAVLSRAGELLDRAGMHRIHALALERSGRGILVLSPRGGGKTTLWLELMKLGGFRLISEDTPILSRSGFLLPFPLRLGIKESDAGSLFFLSRHLRRFVRRNHPPKTLVDAEAFRHMLAKGPVRPSDIIIFGDRDKGCRPSFCRASFLKTAGSLLTGLVMGAGVPQMAEYFLRFTPAGVIVKTGIAMSRLACAAGLMGSARRWRFHRTQDPGKNARTLHDFFS
ncbi:MAG: hypothetical protein ABIG11_02390 [bacterium]